MEHQVDNGEITQLKMHLMSALNGVVIKRYGYNEDGTRGEVQQTLEVPIKYGHRTRQMHEAIQINGHITLPIISVTLTGMGLDPTRNESKNHDLLDGVWGGVDGFKRYVKPTPVNLTFNVKIGTKRGSDLEAILAHYVSVFNPYIQVSWMEPHTKKEIITKVEWDGNVQMELPTDTAAKEKLRYMASLSMTVEGWIFRELSDPVNPIHRIEYNVGDLTHCYFDGFDDDQEFVNENVIDACPMILKVEPEMVLSGDTLTVYGSNISDISGLYLTHISGTQPTLTNYEPFAFSDEFKDVCPPFDGIMVDEYKVIDNNTIEFVVPVGLTAGSTFDILVTNQHSGYTKLSTGGSTRHPSDDIDTENCHQDFITIG